jgi:hypothetical protein
MAHQVSIFLENKLGQIEKVTGVLRDARIDIRSIHLNHTANGWGILNVVVSDPELAQRRLDESGMTAALRRIVAVRIADRPGSLDDLLKHVVEAGVSFENGYGISLGDGQSALFVIDVQDIPDAVPKLGKVGLEIVGDELVYSGKTGRS